MSQNNINIQLTGQQNIQTDVTTAGAIVVDEATGLVETPVISIKSQRIGINENIESTDLANLDGPIHISPFSNSSNNIITLAGSNSAIIAADGKLSAKNSNFIVSDITTQQTVQYLTVNNVLALSPDKDNIATLKIGQWDIISPNGENKTPNQITLKDSDAHYYYLPLNTSTVEGDVSSVFTDHTKDRLLTTRDVISPLNGGTGCSSLQDFRTNLSIPHIFFQSDQPTTAVEGDIWFKPYSFYTVTSSATSEE